MVFDEPEHLHESLLPHGMLEIIGRQQRPRLDILWISVQAGLKLSGLPDGNPLACLQHLQVRIQRKTEPIAAILCSSPSTKEGNRYRKKKQGRDQRRRLPHDRFSRYQLIPKLQA